MDVLAVSAGGLGGAQLVFLIGLSLVIVILLARSRRYFRQVTQFHVPSDRPPRPKALPKAVSAPPRDFERWEVSMHELARDLSGQLDAKIRVLELLIREANETAQRLEQVLRGPASGSGSQRTASGAAGEQARRTRQDVLKTAEAPPQPKAARIKALPNMPSNESREPLKIAGNPRFERVYALADAGLSAGTIANQIGSQVGEVELILSLRGARPA